MKKHFPRLITLTLLAILALSTTSFAEVEFNGKAGLTFNNMACFRGVDTMPGTNYQAVTMGDLTMKGAGPGTLTLRFLGKYGHDVGADRGLKNKRNDVSLAYTLPLFDKKLALTLGNVAYLFSKTTIDNVNEAFIAAKLNMLLNPTITAYYDYETSNNGFFLTAQVNKSFKVAKGLKLKLGALASYNDESSVKIKALYSGFHNAEASASLIWAATKQLSIQPNILFSTPLSSDAKNIANIDDEFRYGIKMAIKF